MLWLINLIRGPAVVVRILRRSGVLTTPVVLPLAVVAILLAVAACVPRLPIDRDPRVIVVRCDEAEVTSTTEVITDH